MAVFPTHIGPYIILLLCIELLYYLLRRDVHVARVKYVCPHCKQSHVLDSSRVLSGHLYTLLIRSKSTVCNINANVILINILIHAFTFGGVLPHQYMTFCLFAGMGEVKQRYIHSGGGLG